MLTRIALLKNTIVDLLLLFPLGFLLACQHHAIHEDVLPLKERLKLESDEALAENKLPVLPAWWEVLGMPELSKAMQSLLQQNQDLLQSRSALHSSYAQFAAADLDHLPVLNAEAGANRRLTADSLGGSGGVSASNSWQAGLKLSWEIDLFARLSYNEKSLLYSFEAQNFEYLASKLLITANYAEKYFSCLSNHKKLELLRRQLGDETELLNLIKLRFDNGVIPLLDVLQQRLQVSQIEAQIPQAEIGVNACENALDYMLGKLPDNKAMIQPQHFQKTLFNPETSYVQQLQQPVPSELVLRNPALMATKKQLLSADAEIGEAIANRLPRLSLSGDIMRVGSEDSASTVSSLGINLIQPLFYWGQRKWAVQQRKAEYNKLLLYYGSEYLKAATELNDIIFTFKKELQLLNMLQKQLELAEKALDESRRRYNSGLSDYLSVLSVLQQVRQLEKQLIDQELQLLSLSVTFFKATGGNTIKASNINPEGK